MLKNRAEFVLIQAAAARLGCATVNCSYRSTPREFEYVVKDSGARLLFFDVEIASVIEHSASVRTRRGAARSIVAGGALPPFS
jgi:fatty-acyl-CoA synthase